MPGLAALLHYSVVYRLKFGRDLRERVSGLIARYPDTAFLSWEGEQATGADTTAKLRALLDALTHCQGLAIVERR